MPRWRICGLLLSMAAMEIERDSTDGAADAADVEPERIPSLGEAPMGAGGAGVTLDDVE